LRLFSFRLPGLAAICAAAALLGGAGAVAAESPVLQPVQLVLPCTRTLTADVVALDQVFFWNRLGAV
jgi:hypothetical protein